MSKVLVTVAVLSALTFTAHLASADDAPPEPKSRDTATLLSVGGTALSIGLVVAGASAKNGTLAGAGLLSSLVTPSAGEIYAGQPYTWGMGIRLVSAASAVAGLREAFKCDWAGDTCHHDPALATDLLVAGGLGYATGIIYDIATAGSAVDEYNRKLNLHVAPTMMRTASSGPAVGVGISGSF
ncbi:MAG TPA: hypothetical protein VF469_30900 [Kofleriaceae bacterium]